MSILAQDTWVPVADGEAALFWSNETDAEDPNFDVRKTEAHENSKDLGQSVNRSGRHKHSCSACADTDWYEMAKDRFAADLADRLCQRVHASDVKRLVGGAAPSVLCELRRTLHTPVEAIIVEEIDKTLTNRPVDKIEDTVTTEPAA